MSEPEQCIICLDPLPRPSSSSLDPPQPQQPVTDDAGHLDIVASLDGCEHIIHDACIRSWAQKTNTCPICRNPFHSVRVYNGVDGTVLSTYDVQDRKQVAEFDVQQWLSQNPDDDDSPSNPCPICNSAEREDVLLLCDSCDAAYHTHCIGLDYVPQGDWYCMECAHVLELDDEPQAPADPAPLRSLRRPNPRDIRGYHVRTRARLRRARRQARNAEWQGAWGQFSGRFFEMSDLDLDNHDDDEELEQYRRFQQQDQRELQRWQQRVNIAQRLGAREEFAHVIPPQISERLQPPPQPVVETRDERRAWGAFDRAREADAVNGTNGVRKRRTRSVTASPAEPIPEPERKLKRPRTRRLPTTQGAEATTSASSPAGPSAMQQQQQQPTSRNGLGRSEFETPLVSSLLKELEPNAPSEDETPALAVTWRLPPEASSPALSPSPSNHSSPRALSLTPPPLPRTNGREASPTMSLSTHIEPRYPPANYSPSRPTSDHSDSDSRPVGGVGEMRPLELRQPRPRRPCPPLPPSRAEEVSGMKSASTPEEKKSINDIVRSALRPHWRAQKLTTEQYEVINRAISRKLYDELRDATSLDEESRRSWEKRATQEVARAVAELQA
ncbi:Ribosomal protein L37ae [Ophiocordyceps camponoti-floridani]|uniref:Ribosomal protein L37ae n=1 Tax=Ophiocordyceps camponoti-floridani TaxID=2030778 RepID=A0A8H4Q1G6_9HYPO|nr:Ribosomal protein L37ae [Ophiocordyceps camponoti-floridani]